MLCGYPPFFDSQPPGLYDKITREEIYFPTSILPLSRDLIIKLLIKDRRNRLGAGGPEEIMRHGWFKKFPWQKFLEKKLTPPWAPELSSPTDLRHIEQLGSEVDANERFASKAGVGAAFRSYGDPTAPVLSLLPMGHILYFLTPGAKITMDDKQQEEQKGQKGQQQRFSKGMKDILAKKELMEGEEEAVAQERDELVERMVEALLLPPDKVREVLVANKWDEQRAMAKLERMAEAQQKDEGSDDD
uniref:AGC-kinase C-terminal domain-containing protein n=3 Tax=Guillardia theta TaxID=55529 RepID=A0A7S4NR37_GUITH|mmetsp:Transcript_29717/g.95080  ORF Transcript_29717/g.95080 Transcript_29717/m.95080 type:complete len:245 (+) Transcript_29717:1058-1792(+)